MQCPNDNTELQMTSREGIEIDYCPKCRGVWLDRGELDKLIERSTGSFGSAHAESTPVASTEHYGRQAPVQGQRRDDDDDDDDHYGRHESHDKHGYGHPPHKKKKEGFLGDLFDF